VSFVDVSGLFGEPLAEIDTLSFISSGAVPSSVFCVFPCGGALVAGTHGAETYSVTSLGFGSDGQYAYVGMIDQVKSQGGLVAVNIMDGNLLRDGFFAMASSLEQPLLLEVMDLNDPDGIALQGDDPEARIDFYKVADIDDPDGLAIYDNGRKAAIVDQDDSRLFILDLETGEILKTIYTGVPGLQHPFDFIPHSGDSIDVLVASDGNTAYVSNIRSNTIAVVDLEAGNVSRLISLPGDPGGPYGLALSPNGRFLFTVTWGSNELLAIDLDTNTVIRRITVGASPVGVNITPDGRVLVANSRDHNLTVVTFPDLDMGN